MEGSGSAAVLGSLGPRKRAGVPTSPTPGSVASLTHWQHEALHNFFKSLLKPKDRAASPEHRRRALEPQLEGRWKQCRRCRAVLVLVVRA